MDTENKNTNNIPGGTNDNNPPREQTPLSDLPFGEGVSEIQQQNAPVAKVSAKTVFTWFFGFALIAVGVFYALLMYALMTGNMSNPLFDALNIQEVSLKETLVLLTNFIFGALALVGLFAMLIKFFQASMTDRNDDHRKRYLKKAVVDGLFLIASVGAWVGMIVLINSVETGPKNMDEGMIITDPEVVVGLDSPQTVHFDIGTKLYTKVDPSNIREIKWDFDGDGVTDANGAQVTYRFLDKGLNEGRYPGKVSVFYYDKEQQKERLFETSREVIIANESVVADFAMAPETGASPIKVDFDASRSYDPDGSIVKYEWDLDGDGTFEIEGETEKKLEEIFDQVGEHKIRLRVTGANKGDVTTVEKILTVTSPEENLRAEINPLSSTSGEAPLEVRLDGLQSFSRKGGITRYEWFVEGEEKVTVGSKFKRTFPNPGEYRVTLTVYNADDEKDQEDLLVEVHPSGKNAELVIRTTPESSLEDNVLRGTVPFEVTFDSGRSKVTDPVEWRWDFESDGIDDAFGEAVKYTFRDPGRHEVRLVIVDLDGEEFETYHIVEANPSGVSAVIRAEPVGGGVPLEVSFDGSGSTVDNGEIVNYIWEFPGQAPLSYSAKVKYEFKDIGNHEVRLTVITADGRKATTSRLVAARAQDLTAKFSFEPQTGYAPLEVVFDARKSLGTITEYRWDFGDGTFSRQANPAHTFQSEGTYNVQLRLTDNRGVVTYQKHNVVVLPVQEN